jgi:hypothetical protein
MDTHVGFDVYTFVFRKKIKVSELKEAFYTHPVLTMRSRRPRGIVDRTLSELDREKLWIHPLRRRSGNEKREFLKSMGEGMLEKCIDPVSGFVVGDREVAKILARNRVELIDECVDDQDAKSRGAAQSDVETEGIVSVAASAG